MNIKMMTAKVMLAVCAHGVVGAGMSAMADPHRPRSHESVIQVKSEEKNRAGLQAALDQAVCCNNHRYKEAIDLFEMIQKTGTPSPRDFYFAAFSYMRLYLPEKADPLLKLAKQAGFSGFGSSSGWPTVNDLLSRIRAVRELTPPSENNRLGLSDHFPVTLYADAVTSWSEPVMRAVPEFSVIGLKVFDARLPPIRLYLFSDRGRFERFFTTLYLVPPRPDQHGTGNTNSVVFCDRDSRGIVTREAGSPETIGAVLHEFGHAWVISYVMYTHNRNFIGRPLRTPWLDEGLADYIAFLREYNYLKRREDWIIQNKVKRNIEPPRLEELKDYSSFHDQGDRELHYWLSALLTAQILGPGDKGAKLIPKLLDAFVETKDAESAVKMVTGKNVRKEYEKLIARFWQRN